MKQFFEYKPSPKEVISCLVAEYQWLSLLKGKNKPYESFLPFIEETGRLESEDGEYYDKNRYQITSIAKEVGKSSAIIRKWVFSIYDDLLTLNKEEPQLFNNGQAYHYVLSFESFYGYYSEFNIWLPVKLSHSDSFHFDFIFAKMNISYFWVKKVAVQHHNGNVRIEVDLLGGIYNRYQELVLDKAYLLETYPFSELYYSNLYLRYKKVKEYARKERL